MPAEPNIGTILVTLFFGIGPLLLFLWMFQMAFSNPTGMTEEEAIAAAEAAIREQGLAADELER